MLEQAIDRESEAFKGHSRNYLPVLVRAGEGQVNREVDVHIEGVMNGWLIGKIIENKEERAAVVNFEL